MPSALETLVKILKLEREQGYKNTAVIGGLSAFAEKWQKEAHAQARRPEHHALVDELATALSAYDALPNREARHDAIKQMMSHITGRVAPSPGTASQTAAPPPKETAPAPPTKSKPKPAARPASPKPARPAPPRRPVASSRPAELAEAPTQQGRATAPEPVEEEHEAPPQIARAEQSNLDLFEPADAPTQYEPEPAVAPPKPKPRRKPRRPRPFEEAVDALRGLDAPVGVIPGVGVKMAEKLARLGIQTVSDLLFHLPRRYDDYTRLVSISQAKAGESVTLIGTVRNCVALKGRGGREYLQFTLDDGTATLNVFFFGQMYLRNRLVRGTQVVVSGETDLYLGKLSMTNPEWELLEYDNLHTRAIVPVYPLTQGVTTRMLRRMIRATVDYWAERLPDYLPESVLERAELVDLGWALRQVHFPDHWDYLHYARERLAFDELFLLQMRMLTRRRAWQSVPATPLDVADEWLESAIAALPYTLTQAQRRALEDIRTDMARQVPMNRLLQGDVGSGKTVVAALAAAIAMRNGGQAALMAPTGILAEQHFRSINRTLAALPLDSEVNVRLLTGATPDAEREAILAGIADGSVQMVIGTHALIQGGVAFANLALAIIDEQHRFGVAQRAALRGKGTNPHLLVMTATPIPRTLALTIHADLDLSVIDEMPPGRMPVETHVLPEQERERAYSFITHQIENGRQAFIIYPLVESSEDGENETRAAVDEFARLQKEIFPHLRLGLLHGRMSAQDKEAVMLSFQAGEIDLLVSTSVVEVGIDVPNATVILIEGANRFGLAQLHQFRGRVGRGEHPSTCLLIGDTATASARERLEAMARTTDGFELAEIDFRLRGAGDLFGTRQSGGMQLRFGNDMNPQLVALAQREARTLYEEDPELVLPEHRLLAERVMMTATAETDLS